MNWFVFAAEAAMTFCVYLLAFAHGAIWMRRSIRKLMKTAEFGKMYTFTDAVQRQADWMNKTGGTVDEAAMFNLRKAFHNDRATQEYEDRRREADPSAEAGDDGTRSEWRDRQDD